MAPCRFTSLSSSVVLKSDTYDKIPLVGRVISALFDLGAILLLFTIGQRLYGKKVGAAGGGPAGLERTEYPALTFLRSGYLRQPVHPGDDLFPARASSSGRWLTFALAGLMFGMGLASKLSTITLAVPILAAIGLDVFHRSRTQSWIIALEQSLVRLLTVFVLAALTFRVLQPVAFTGPTIMNWELNPAWVEDVFQQQYILTGTTSEPWVQQWTGRSFLFPFYNLVAWGLGVPLGLAGFAGFGLAAYELIATSQD